MRLPSDTPRHGRTASRQQAEGALVGGTDAGGASFDESLPQSNMAAFAMFATAVTDII
jgi:hypothetical protein